MPRHGLHYLLTIALGVIAFAPLSGASAWTEKKLYAFCQQANCADGAAPQGALLMDQSGDLFGATGAGGTSEGGLVFELVPNANKSQYTEEVLYRFCAQANCTDGEGPNGDLVVDKDGNLYGTTSYGGQFGGGAVFKLMHQGSSWSLTVIQSFCAAKKCAGGNRPYTGLSYPGQASGAPWDEFSPLFGTTYYGGAYGQGTAYKLIEDGSLWNYEVIHSFRAAPPFDTANPGPILVDSAGNLLGVTESGGKYGGGVLYRLAVETWKEIILHNFCVETNCADGEGGVGRLATDAAGNLFGVTAFGGASIDDEGVIFERTAGGTYKVLYDFCSQTNCSDGFSPDAGLFLDASGNLFGTTVGGGQFSHGVAFEQTASGTHTTIYTFCSLAKCKDNANPDAALIGDSAGNIYGTTSAGGGKHDEGVVFRLAP